MRVPHLTINGAGIGGLATALALHSKGLVPNLNVNILERNPLDNAWVGRGAGLNLQPHAVKVLDEIGLMNEVIAKGWAPMNQQYFTNNGRLIVNSPRGLNVKTNSYPQISIHRGELHTILNRAVVQRLGPDTIKRGLAGVSYVQNEDGVRLECTDPEGKRYEIQTDAVIGADGIHSGMRKALLHSSRGKSEAGPLKSGINVYRGTAMIDKVLDGHTVVLAGRSDAKLVCYPLEPPKLVMNPDGSMGQKQLLNFVVEVAEASDPTDAGGNQDDLAEYVAGKLEDLNGGFDLPFLDHRKMLKEADSLKGFPMSDRDPLETWCDDRVVLLGDAAHPMYPVGSNGASSALLDATEIANLFEKNFKTNPSINHQQLCETFQEYETARLPAVTSVQLACRELLPEQVMDRVQQEVPGEQQVPTAYGQSLLQALAVCQAGTKKSVKGRGSIKPLKPLKTPAAFVSTDLVANFSPMERVMLAANGSLQRTISAMTNSDIVVDPVMTCARDNQFLDREVNLHLESVDGPLAVRCKTTVIPQCDDIKRRMLSQEIGIGQLVTERRKAGKEEPAFKLLACGKAQDDILTRQYILDFPGDVSFLIYEEIDVGVILGEADRINSNVSVDLTEVTEVESSASLRIEPILNNHVNNNGSLSNMNAV